MCMISRQKFIPAHERFAHLLAEKPSITEPSITPKKSVASPADLRRAVQVTEHERVSHRHMTTVQFKYVSFVS
jgi:hypothetical protein